MHQENRYQLFATFARGSDADRAMAMLNRSGHSTVVSSVVVLIPTAPILQADANAKYSGIARQMPIAAAAIGSGLVLLISALHVYGQLSLFAGVSIGVALFAITLGTCAVGMRFGINESGSGTKSASPMVLLVAQCNAMRDLSKVQEIARAAGAVAVSWTGFDLSAMSSIGQLNNSRATNGEIYINRHLAHVANS